MFLIIPFDVLRGTWPTRWSFPAFWVQAVQFMAVGADLDVKQSYDPGSTPRIPRTNLQKVDVNLKKIRLNGPSDRKSTRLNSSHSQISYAVFCLKKKKNQKETSHHPRTNHTDN